MTGTPEHDPDTLTRIRDLESRFAAAMTQLYAVGNGLASLRHDVESGRASAVTAPTTPATTDAASTPGVPDAPEAAPDATEPVPAPVPQAQGAPTVPVPPSAPAGHRPPAVPLVPPQAAGPAASHPLPQPHPTSAAPHPTAGAAPGTPTGPTGVPAPGPQEHWWERPGAVARVLGAAGAVITLFGVAFLLAIAIAAGVFGPVPRVISGAFLAVALVAGGVAARRRSPETVGGEALVATGLAAAYLDLLAATALYDFIPGPAGLVLAALLTIGAFVLARRWNSQLLAILAAAPPMVLAPFITGITSQLTLSFIALLLVGSALAHLGREWPWLYVARVLPAVGVLLVGVPALHKSPFPLLTITGATALGMVAAGATEQAPRWQPLTTLAAFAASTPLLLAVATLSSGRLAVSASLTVVFLAVAALSAAAGVSGRLPQSLWLAPLVTGTMLLVIAAVALPDRDWTGPALAAAAGAYLVVARWRRSPAVAWSGAALAGLSALGFLPRLAATTTEFLADSVTGPAAVLHGLALTGLALLGVHTVRALHSGDRERTWVRLAAASMFVTGSATVILFGTWIGRLIHEPRLGFYGGHAAATALWTVLAGVLLTVLAKRHPDERAVFVRTGLGLIAAAAAKLFLFDLGALSGLFRVVAFIVSGVIVLIIGVAYARTPEGPRYGETVPPVPGAPGPEAGAQEVPQAGSAQAPAPQGEPVPPAGGPPPSADVDVEDPAPPPSITPPGQ
ncbi:MAG TPA: DUF2339 domain-containing protein [Intrasporangiaceae bacterium]|nr:DUF2339 domain-containing protein [Intrasporangiaceae bacterium]